MKLSQMGFRHIHCMIYEQDGRIITEFNEKRISELMERRNEFVLVYNPNIEQKKEILSLMNVSSDNKVTVDSLKLLGVFELLTNIDLGIASGELTTEEALDIVNNPNELLNVVNQAVNSIIVDVLKEQLNAIEEVVNLPEPVKRSVLEDTMLKEKREQEAKKQAEIEELEAKLRALRGE